MESKNYSKRSWGEVKNLRFFTTRDNPCSSEDKLPPLKHRGFDPPLKFVSSVTISAAVREPDESFAVSGSS